jgi:MoxR-vWA-beta-propeller ternary system domain bpX4
MQNSANEPGMVSDLALFLKSLVQEGRAAVSVQPLPHQTDDALSVLKDLDAHARNELALDLPAFSAATALWSARLFYQLCRFTVCRDLGEKEIVAVCSVVCPEPRTPETDWSADQVLRHLPMLFQLARHLSNADPLLLRMKEIAAAWPLSSVGIAGLENLQLDSFVDHPGLRRLYAERIIASGDTSRLGDARVNDLLRADLGLHHDLAPSIARELFSKTSHDTN